MTDTLMHYDIFPTRFEVDATNATLQIQVTPRKVSDEEGADPWDDTPVHASLFLHEITIDIAVDGRAADLTGAPTQIEHPTPVGWRLVNDEWAFGPLAGWSFKHDPTSGGRFVAKPKSPVEIGANSVILLSLSNINVNIEGTTVITVTEHASLGSADAEVQETPLPCELHKRSGFHVGQIRVDKRHVQNGGQVALSWSGSAGADYSIHWMQDGKWQELSNLPSSSALMESGSPVVGNLTDPTTFILKTDPRPPNSSPNEITVFVPDLQPIFHRFTADWNSLTELELRWNTERYESVIITNTEDGVVQSAARKGVIKLTQTKSKRVPASFTLTATRHNKKDPDVWVLQADGPWNWVEGQPIEVGNNPVSVVPSPDGTRMLVAQYDEKTILQFYANTGELTEDAPVKLDEPPTLWPIRQTDCGFTFFIATLQS